MSKVSDIDEAIETAEFGSDRQATLLVERGDLLGHALSAEHLAHRFGCTVDEAHAILNRLVVAGYIEAHPHTRLDPVRNAMRRDA